jgi:hypothetical protein
MSGKGDCYDNAFMESFFGTLKTECVDRQSFHNQAQARQAIFEYLEVFSNRQRLHSSLGYVSPVTYEQQVNRVSTFLPSSTKAGHGQSSSSDDSTGQMWENKTFSLYSLQYWKTLSKKLIHIRLLCRFPVENLMYQEISGGGICLFSTFPFKAQGCHLLLESPPAVRLVIHE